MLRTRTLRILMYLVVGYGVLVVPAFFWDPFFDSPAGYLVLVPFLSVYMFHKLGVPGLLENDGLCGWGWCSPTLVGWVFLVVFWLVVAWCIAWGVAALFSRLGARQPH